MVLKYIAKSNNYRSINQLLKTELNISSRLLVKLIKNNKIMLNGNLCDTRITPKLNDKIQIMLDYEENNSNIQPIEMTLDIIYEDEGLLIVNKPSGIAVHPSMRHYEDSLSNGVRFYYDKIGLKKKIRPVNRLDIDTSGIVIFAKNEYIQECLIKQMKEGSFKKEYVCAVLGMLEEKKNTINLPIARKKGSIIERCVSKDGKTAITHYEVINEKHNYSIVKCLLETGRTHQIRVHFAYIGHPLLGDTLYGTQSNLISRQALHCCNINFIHPILNKKIQINCKYPKDIEKLM